MSKDQPIYTNNQLRKGLQFQKNTPKFLQDLYERVGYKQEDEEPDVQASRKQRVLASDDAPTVVLQDEGLSKEDIQRALQSVQGADEEDDTSGLNGGSSPLPKEGKIALMFIETSKYVLSRISEKSCRTRAAGIQCASALSEA